jgi:hypothetical protein
MKSIKGSPLTYAEKGQSKPENKHPRAPKPKISKPIVCFKCCQPGGTLLKIEGEKNKYKHAKC